jgi:ribonuclease PH
MSEFVRADGRSASQLRPIQFQPGIAPHATGSVLISWGNTRVICAVTIEESVPKWMQAQKITGGWLTAEYSMLPYSTLDRKARDISKLKLDGRSQEIQRLIGRSLRASLDLEALGARTVWIDCDVLQADGGTRTASITGAYVALALALRRIQAEGKLATSPLRTPVAAVSLGVVADQVLLDLAYVEDRDAAVDLNLVMDGRGRFIELQASGEESTFSSEQLDAMLAHGRDGIRRILELQQAALSA